MPEKETKTDKPYDYLGPRKKAAEERRDKKEAAAKKR